MRTRIAAAALTAAAFALTACSSGSTSDDSAKTTTPAGATATDTKAADTAALTKAVTDYTAKLFAGDPNGYTYLSARCKTQLTHDAWNQLATQGHHDYGSQKATGIHIDQLSGDLARVSYGAGNIPAMSRKGQPWTREDGAWRWDACQTTS